MPGVCAVVRKSRGKVPSAQDAAGGGARGGVGARVGGGRGAAGRGAAAGQAQKQVSAGRGAAAGGRPKVKDGSVLLGMEKLSLEGAHRKM